MPGRSTQSLEVIRTTMALFRKAPSTAFKSGLFAACVSWAIVAVANAESCLSQSSECIVASPAVFLYWAPIFLACWALTALGAMWLRRRKGGNDF